jgi:hypothetical protein
VTIRLSTAISTLGVVLGLSLGSIRPVSGDDERVFDPLKHFPDRSLAYIGVRDVRDLASRAAEALPFRLFADEAWRNIASALSAEAGFELAPATAAVQDLTGLTLEAITDLFRGGIAIDIVSVLPIGAVEFAASIDIGDRRADWETLLGRLAEVYTRETQQAVESSEVGGDSVKIWRTPRQSIYQLFLGRHLVLVSDIDVLRDVQGLFHGTAARRPIGESPFLVESLASLALEDPAVVVAFDLGAIRGLVFPLLALQGDVADAARRIIRLIGLGNVTSLAFGAGISEHSVEIAFQLGARDGFRGIFDSISRACRPVEDVEALFARVPESASHVAASRFSIGSLLGDVHRLITEALPESREPLAEAFEKLETETGISVANEIFTLGELTALSYLVWPPLGSVVPDVVTLVPTKELDTHWRLLEKVFARFGVPERRFRRGGVELRHFDTLEIAKRRGDGRSILERLEAFSEPRGQEELVELLICMLGGICRRDLDDGWTVLSANSQALVRDALVHRPGPRLTASSELVRLAKERWKGAALGCVSRPGGCFYIAYNSLVDVLGVYAGLLGSLGLRTIDLPAAEEFREFFRPSFASVESTSKSLSFHSRSQSEFLLAAYLAVLFAIVAEEF